MNNPTYTQAELLEEGVTYSFKEDGNTDYVLERTGNTLAATKREWAPDDPKAFENWVELAYMAPESLEDLNLVGLVRDLDDSHEELEEFRSYKKVRKKQQTKDEEVIKQKPYMNGKYGLPEGFEIELEELYENIELDELTDRFYPEIFQAEFGSDEMPVLETDEQVFTLIQNGNDTYKLQVALKIPTENGGRELPVYILNLYDIKQDELDFRKLVYLLRNYYTDLYENEPQLITQKIQEAQEKRVEQQSNGW